MLIVIHTNNTNFCFFLPGVILSWHHVAADLNKRTQLLDNNGRERAHTDASRSVSAHGKKLN